MPRVTPNWTKEAEDALIARYLQEGPDALAAEFGRPRRAIVAKAYRLGVTSGSTPSNRDWVRLRRERVLRDFWMTEPPYVTAKRVNRPLPEVAAEALSLGLPPDTWVRHAGRYNGKERVNYAPATIAPPKPLVLTADDVRWMREEGKGTAEALLIAAMQRDRAAVVRADVGALLAGGDGA